MKDNHSFLCYNRIDLLQNEIKRKSVVIIAAEIQFVKNRHIFTNGKFLLFSQFLSILTMKGPFLLKSGSFRFKVSNFRQSQIKTVSLVVIVPEIRFFKKRSQIQNWGVKAEKLSNMLH